MTTYPQIISIEGNIGSGKSTLLLKLQEIYKNNPDIYFVDEPINIWNEVKDKNGITILKKYYANTEKYAFQFQIMAYISRLSLLKKALLIKNIKYIITERSVFTDANVFAKMLYDTDKITHIEYTIYKMWFDEFAIDLMIYKVVYIKTEPHIAYERIHIRNRLGEEIIPLIYLENCHKYHEDWLNTSNYNQLTIDGNINIDDGDNNIINNWINSISIFIYSNNE